MPECFGKRLAYLQIKLSLVVILSTFNLQKTPESLSGYEAIDRLTHKPKQCYICPESIRDAGITSSPIKEPTKL